MLPRVLVSGYVQKPETCWGIVPAHPADVGVGGVRRRVPLQNRLDAPRAARLRRERQRRHPRAVLEAQPRPGADELPAEVRVARGRGQVQRRLRVGALRVEEGAELHALRGELLSGAEDDRDARGAAVLHGEVEEGLVVLREKRRDAGREAREKARV